jgi:hypothetical protein
MSRHTASHGQLEHLISVIDRGFAKIAAKDNALANDILFAFALTIRLCP